MTEKILLAKISTLKNKIKILKNKIRLSEVQVASVLVKWNIVVPCYNYGQFLEKCVLSLLKQTEKNFVITIVNDASTDRTDEICNQLIKVDSRIRYIKNEKNTGLSAVRNKAIESIISKYVFIIDADDWAEPDILAKAEILFEKGADVVCPQILFHYEDGKTHPWWNNPNVEYTFENFCKQNLCSSNSPFKRECWEKVGGYKHVYWEDLDFCLALLQNGYKFKWLGGKPFVHMLKHNVSRSWLNQELLDAANAELALKYKVQIANIKPTDEIIKKHIITKISKNKICVILPLLKQGGVEKWFMNLVEATPELEYTLIITMRQEPLYQPWVEKLQKLGVKVYTNTLWKGNTAINTDGIVSKAREIAANSDLILCTHEHLIEEITKNINKPVLFAIHAYHQWLNQLIDKTLPYVTRYGVVSKQIVDFFPEEYKNRIEVIYNSVDLNNSISFNSKSRLHEKFGIPSTKKVIAFFSRLDVQKSPEVLAHCLKNNSNSNLLGIYFSGTETAREVEIKNKILNINEDVKFYPPATRIGEIIAIADVIFMPSQWEGCSLLMLEAWANKIPVISTPVGIVSEMEEKYGEVVYKVNVPILDENGKPDNLDQINRVIDKAVEDKHCIRDKCFEIFVKEFGATKAFLKWRDYMLSLIPRG